MRPNRSSRPAGLVIIGWFALAFVARIDTADASDCPCINGGAGVCIRDPACEARERDRLMHQDVSRMGHSDVPTVARPSTPPVPQAPMETAHSPSSSTPTPMSRQRVTRSALAPVPEPRLQQTTQAASFPMRCRSAAGPESSKPAMTCLSELGKEDSGYGLYSYAILPSDTTRSEIFLTELFKEIPSLGQTAAPRPQLNIILRSPAKGPASRTSPR